MFYYQESCVGGDRRIVWAENTPIDLLIGIGEEQGLDYWPVEADKVGKFELCKGRHQTPANEAIFENTINPTNIRKLDYVAWQKIHRYEAIELYVTGMTPALIAVLNIAAREHISVVLWHYDRETGEYFSQVVESLN